MNKYCVHKLVKKNSLEKKMFLLCFLNLFSSSSLRKHSLQFQTILVHVVEINEYKIPFQESSDGCEEKQTQDKGGKLNKDVNINHSTAQQ